MTRGKGSIPSQFVPHRIEMLESPAWRTLSLSGRRVIDRIEIEQGHHGGNDNGRLPVTFDDFELFGVSRKSIAPGIREVQALGFAEITQRGRPSESDFGRHPNHFRLTYLPVKRGSRWCEPTDEWKQIKAIEEACKIAQEARDAKDEQAVAKAKRKAKRRAAQKSDAGGEKIPVTGGKNHPETNVNPGGKNHPTDTGGNFHPTIYISGEGEAA
jgi:hypothetical protein